MFLNRLNLTEKGAFVSMAFHAAKANGQVEEEEKIMIGEYCKEMGLTLPDDVTVKPMNELMDVYSNSDLQHKKIVVLEIIGMMYADGEYDNDEKEFVKSLAQKLELSTATLDEIELALEKYIEVTRELVKCID